jgi:hypothetical protein
MLRFPWHMPRPLYMSRTDPLVKSRDWQDKFLPAAPFYMKSHCGDIVAGKITWPAQCITYDTV